MAIVFDSARSGASDRLIADFETRQGVKLPVAVKAFLRRHNGGSLPSNFSDTPAGRAIGVGVTELLGLMTGDEFDIEVRLHELRGRAPEWFIPIFDAEGGNVVGVSVAGNDVGGIYFWDHEMEEAGGSVVQVADSLDSFVESLRDIDDWDVEEP